MMNNGSVVDPLTPREQVILQRLDEDLTNAEIATAETLALSSVKWYVQQIFRKLGVENRRKALTKARKLGLLGSVYRAVDSRPLLEEMLANLPSGTVTFLFTDIQGSTPLWEQMPEAMQAAVALHHKILRQAIDANGGHVFQVVGNAFQAAFRLAFDGLSAALAIQTALQSAAWGSTGPLKVRMGMHTGLAERDPYGNTPYTVNHSLSRATRVMSCGHGGQILLTQETADMLLPELPEGISLRDLGEHHLKGIQRLEHLYQVVAPQLPHNFPPLVSDAGVRHNLSRRRTSYIGRAELIETLKTWLGEYRLITLTGSGGVGKTSLSLQVGEAGLERFPDGVWLVELAAITDPGLVDKGVATALGLHEEASRPIQDTLLDYLRMKSILIILDNCEHLLESCTRLVDLLLITCPELHILATSREPLNVSGEKIYRVPSLQFPDADRLPDLLFFQQYEAVRLFIERARIAQPDFVATEDNARSIAQVCKRLDGIPLAIELAAARMSMLSIDQLAGRLDNAFRLLTGGARTALPRQQTLQAAIDWSYQLLNEVEKTLLSRLAVFSSSFDLEAAEAVCGVGAVEVGDAPHEGSGDTLDLLTSLFNKSLLITEYEPQVGMRYRLLGFVRQYARVKLYEAGESQRFRDRHLDYYVTLAERGVPHLRSAGRMAWTKRLGKDLDNFREALEWAYQDPTTPQQELRVQLGLRIVASLGRRLFWPKGFAREAIDWLCKGLGLAEGQTIPPLLMVKVTCTLASLYAILKDSDGCLVWSEKCLQLCRAVGSAADNEFSWALSLYGSSYARVNKDFSQIRVWKDESVQVARGMGPDSVFYLALALYNRIKYNEDLYLGYQDALESKRLFLKSGDRWSAALPLWWAGYYFEMGGDFAEALRCYEEAFTLFEEIEDQVAKSFTYIYLGRLYRKMAEFDRALACHAEYIRLWNQIGGRERLPDGFAHVAIDWYCQELERMNRIGQDRFDGLFLARLTRLIAAAENLQKFDYEYLFDQDRALFDQALETARRELGEKAYQSTWEQGRELTQDDAVSLACGRMADRSARS